MKSIAGFVLVLSIACTGWVMSADEKSKTEGGEKKKEEKTFDREKRIKELTPIQYKVAVKDGTERAFTGAYWDNKKDGLYLDIISGKPLFSSKEKYKSGTGWPSFWKPFDDKEIVEKKDRKLFVVRTEVRSKTGDTHLGHVFTDGPKPTGLRYCINSAALRFVAVEDFDKEGLGEFKKLFEEAAKKETKAATTESTTEKKE